MSYNRRALIAGLAATLLAPRRARAASVTDGAGRAVPVPARVERVFPAGPPAAIFLYTLAPELLIGWPRANRPQQQTGIPYALLDGRFEGIPLSYRTLGALIGRREQGESLARNAEDTMKTVTQRVGSIPPDRRPRVYYARGPRGLETGLGGSINVETIELVAQNVAGGTRGGLANVSIEQVLLWNPDVIITIDQDFAA